MDIVIKPLSPEWLKKNQPKQVLTHARYFADDFVVHEPGCTCQEEEE